MFTLITFKSINLLSSTKSYIEIIKNLTNYIDSIGSIAKLRLSMCINFF